MYDHTSPARTPQPRTAPDDTARSAPATPANAPVGGRGYAASNVTRLLCAGTYLDDGYRRAVIQALLTERFRQVAPSYGYDVIPVLGHALAARRLRMYHSVLTFTGLFLFVLLRFTHALSSLNAFLLFAWWAWSASYLLRLVSLETLMREFRPAETNGGARSRSRGPGFRGGYPEDENLGADRVDELIEQQSADTGVIYYGGFTPFVGAGFGHSSWTNAELLVEAPPNPFADSEEFAGLKKFTVAEITDYVARRLKSDLCDEASPPTRIENLVIERRRYTKAVARRVSEDIDPFVSVSEVHWEESYAAAREFLCIRVGAWDQEVVTSMFVGFDLKGNTLHTEFYPYVLPPIREAFHIVDRLPEHFTPRLVFRIAFDTLRALPFEAVRTVIHPLAHRLPRPGDVAEQLDRKLAKLAKRGGHAGESSLGLARYAGIRIDRGANASIRELATPNKLHHFFQKADIVKYTQIVERSLLRIIEDFLYEHNVDLTDHRAAAANILNQSFGDVHNHGNGNVVSQGNLGKQSIRARAAGARTHLKDA
ncbi:hypothetical protein KDL01_33910 [Actinospica durhamensis]|uniref:Uncharacterized protein n=1 Tax=Actinospica durhamensis TaxID=1508375 RepID=A0A941EV55_9ACTN|nr:hypothetical protein [Actinospica durhamensis]MBR7838315.1 hypothetical protein [Actinospica durhamensis]